MYLTIIKHYIENGRFYEKQRGKVEKEGGVIVESKNYQSKFNELTSKS